MEGKNKLELNEDGSSLHSMPPARRKFSELVREGVDRIWDWMFAHELLVTIVSSVFGSILGIWLAFEFVIPIMAQIITQI